MSHSIFVTLHHFDLVSYTGPELQYICCKVFVVDESNVSRKVDTGAFVYIVIKDLYHDLIPFSIWIPLSIQMMCSINGLHSIWCVGRLFLSIFLPFWKCYKYISSLPYHLSIHSVIGRYPMLKTVWLYLQLVLFELFVPLLYSIEKATAY